MLSILDMFAGRVFETPELCYYGGLILGLSQSQDIIEQNHDFIALVKWSKCPENNIIYSFNKT